MSLDDLELLQVRIILEFHMISHIWEARMAINSSSTFGKLVALC